MTSRPVSWTALGWRGGPGRRSAMHSGYPGRQFTRSTEVGVFERFTAEAVRSVHAAVALAEERGDPGIGTEHLLVGSATESEDLAALVGSAHQLIETMDRLDRDALAEFGVEAPGDRIRPPVSRRRRHRPFTSGAKQGFKDALAEGVMLGHRHLGPEHVLLAITRRTRNDPA